MRASELRELSEEELQNKEKELKEQLFKLKIQHSLGQLDNPMKMKLIKRDIARIKTILNERRREQANNEGKK
ncbi:50S ribosomal protein L29 [Candidatus Aminicenantes bacterium AC-708-M15]|jgi:large subunit ribosomal protein L29|nr:50S ribosomal protein L29 [SCandidatus Aminicenantes bacterium Aminicenantia_JdfR_composite]MCP2599127.1 50S ribosomal protein L29 [Candidatus Aminicenantes bacterium AC-335-B20]MCP2604068.1 50S ribosomal protein L29 [Candidatus Aminicenantes bacterium AC-708-M15]MCP2605357.1 50S ribosomal protein L29 [Candidatus Aminicenantes bacterium AC-335-O07]MCP2606032.1 50S ribosomal protein L29 [Candidatus Aminicenantes bacterium AC-708-I09]MCP2617876.1 50S ribosomal protein L29 [Candidatus Aminicen